MWVRTFFLFVFELIICYSCFSAHFIGGEMTYSCKDEGVYEVTLILYRDCVGNGANFDSAGTGIQGTITVYESPDNLISNIILDAPLIEEIDWEENLLCNEIIGQYCLQRGIYEFSIELPPNGNSYYLIYQRCCLVNTVTNIENPQEVGMTQIVEITPFAQEVCNSSPEFNNLTESLVCVNEHFDINFSGVDIDDDVLIYSHCI